MINTSTAYQWQRSLDRTSWTDLPGKTEETFVTPVDYYTTYYYRCLTTVHLLDIEDDYTITTPAYQGATVSRTLIAAPSCIGELVNTIPSQFQDKPKILSVLKAYARQRDELNKLFLDLNVVTDVDTAVGQNLDYVGSIVSMTRTEAFQAMNAPAGLVMDDATYRNCLKFKILANNTNGTYADIMKGLDLLWPGVTVKYSEPSDRNAAFMISLENVDIDAEDPSASAPLIIRAGGVQMILETTYLHEMDTIDQEVFTDEMISYNSIAYWNGDFLFDGSRTFQAEAEVSRL